MRDALDAGIRSRWLELAEDGAPWPCDFAEAGNVVLRTPGKDDGGESDGAGSVRAGALAAEAVLPADASRTWRSRSPASSRRRWATT